MNKDWDSLHWRWSAMVSSLQAQQIASMVDTGLLADAHFCLMMILFKDTRKQCSMCAFNAACQPAYLFVGGGLFQYI